MENKKNSVFKKLLFVLAVLAGIAGVAVGIMAALVSTAITIGMLIPVALGLLLGTWGLARLWRPGSVIGHKGLRRAVIICVCLGLIAVVFFEALMFSALAAPPPDDEPDVVLVLGCGIFADGRLTYSLKSRLDKAYDALEAYPDALCIVSGGQGDNEPIPEAQAMRNYLALRGVDKERIFMESESRNTAENMQFSKEIMEEHGVKTAAVITSDYHVYRALKTAKSYDIEAFGIGSDTNWRVRVAMHIREYLAIVKQAVFGGGAE